MVMGIIVCKICKVEVRRHINPKVKNTYCSIKCKSADTEALKESWTTERRHKMSERQSGCNNPNFGNTWSGLQKEAASARKKLQYLTDPALRYKCGAANRGKKFSKERIAKMHAHRESDSYRRVHSQETRNKIGKLSKSKFTEEYNSAYRKTMESRGLWIPLSKKTKYELYFQESNWIENMINFFSESEIISFKLHGIFNRNNTKGWVRDHIVPRNIGYTHDLPPYILRHPANLQFISHSANIAKGFKDRALDGKAQLALITELFNKILSFDKIWKEHDTCVSFIKERRLSDE